MILIISSKRDGHITPVIDHLVELGTEFVRINTEDLATNVNVTIDPNTGIGILDIKDSNKTVKLEEVSAVWYRKPDPANLSHFEIDEGDLDYIEAEFNELLQGIYSSLTDQAIWINNPLTTRISHRKVKQLQIASSLGFQTPKSIITNNEQEALQFAESVSWDVAIKSLGALSVTTDSSKDTEKQVYGIFTRRISKDELLQVSSKVQYMPTLFQEYVEKAYELRITCVGDKVFACKIDSQSHVQGVEDYRLKTKDLPHEMVDCSHIKEQLLAYLDRFQLNFGCFDFIVTPEGEYVFLECNPNGQWLWIQHMTGAPISKAVAELLSENAHNYSNLINPNLGSVQVVGKSLES